MNSRMLKRNILFFVAVILLLAWGIGFFILTLGLLIHSLLFLAAVAIVIRFALKRRQRRKEIRSSENILRFPR